MNFEQKLKKLPAAAVWQEYCGFLDLSLEEYMGIQRRLLMEQISLMDQCALGRRMFGGAAPKTPEEFRARVPLTTFSDYADVLLTRCSLTALKRHLRGHGEAPESLADVVALLDRQPRPTAFDEWIDDAVAALVPAVMAASAVLDVSHVVLDGDLPGLVGEIIDRLETAIAAACPESVRPPQLIRGTFGPAAGAIGAATLPLFFNFSPRPTILTGAADPVAEPRGPETE